MTGSSVSFRSMLLACLAVCTGAMSLAAGAAEREKGSIMIGAFVTDRDTNTRLDSDQGNGTDLDLEDDLGFDRSTSVGRLGGYYWFRPRHRFDFSVFDLSRDASKQIDETIEFGDSTFIVNTVVTSQSDVTITKLDYTFVALDRDQGYLGIVGGLYNARLGMSVGEPALGTAETGHVNAPLPVIGLRGEYAIGERITLRGAAQWFVTPGGDFEGRLRDIYFGADYGIGDRTAIGLAYNLASMDIEVDKPGFEGILDWGYDGVMLYFKVDFGR